VSEAAYLKKPVLMVPVENHLEQQMNSIDAEDAGLGLADTRFDLSRLLAHHQYTNSGFRCWVQQAEEIFMRVISEVISWRTVQEALPTTVNARESYVQQRIKEMGGV
jgi:hypothetical protein